MPILLCLYRIANKPGGKRPNGRAIKPVDGQNQPNFFQFRPQYQKGKCVLRDAQSAYSSTNPLRFATALLVTSNDLKSAVIGRIDFFVTAFLPPPAVPDRHRADDASREYPLCALTTAAIRPHGTRPKGGVVGVIGG